jgi:hypothetical protein
LKRKLSRNSKESQSILIFEKLSKFTQNNAFKISFEIVQSEEKKWKSEIDSKMVKIDKLIGIGKENKLFSHLLKFYIKNYNITKKI